MLTIDDLTPEVRERLDHYALDVVIDGKRERWLWASMLAGSAKFLDLSGYVVLFPQWSHQPPQIDVERLCVDAHGDTVVFTFRDNVLADRLMASEKPPIDHGWIDFNTSFLVVCERVPEQDFFITTAYHECQLTTASRLETLVAGK